MLHAQIFNLFHRYKRTQKKQVLVLVTGDGNINESQTSFPIVVETVLQEGWGVELWSWKQSLNDTFFKIQRLLPHGFTINYLDPHREQITFEQRYEPN